MRMFFSVILCFLLSAAPFSRAQAGLIRDAEVEHTIRTLVTPVFKSANLDPDSVHIFIISSPAINAFVAGGMNIFLHTGLLLATDRPEMLAGVVAHETGHITGGHLAKGAEQLERATIGAVLSYIVGGIAVASGASDVGAAVMSGGGTLAQRGMLSFTRTNETAADAAALRFLEASHISAEGLLDMFKRLRRDEKQHYGKLDPYAVTHPLSSERIDTLRDYLSRNTQPVQSFDQEQQDLYQRMVGKLEGFLDDPHTVQARYQDAPPGLRGRYALAIAAFREGDADTAIEKMKHLINERPQDGYYYDTLGQILYESGRIPQAIEAYKKAVTYAPREGLIHASYGQALLAAQTPATLPEATHELELATQLDNTYADAWRALAGAYGRAGKIGDQHLALAEEAMLDDKLEDAIAHSKLALKHLETGSPARMRASDLNTLAVRQKSKKEDEKTPFLR